MVSFRNSQAPTRRMFQIVCRILRAELPQKELPAKEESLLFKGCPKKAKVARYHSLAADADTMPDCLKITATTDDGEIMAVEHKEYPIYGVQFHPESIYTEYGKRMIENFIR